jgi:hypothetical protein
MSHIEDEYELTDVPKVDALAYLRSIYNDPSAPKSMRLKAAIEALPYERPSLRATASIVMGGDFAMRLDKAIERSGVGVLIEHQAPAPMRRR